MFGRLCPECPPCLNSIAVAGLHCHNHLIESRHPKYPPVTAPSIKPTRKSIAAYYDALKTYKAFKAAHEGATETAFSQLLATTASSQGWVLIPKQPHKVNGKTIFPDGTLRDLYNLARGYWEAKDTSDDLDDDRQKGTGSESSRCLSPFADQKKIKSKYPLTNIIFEDTREAVLFQSRKQHARYDLTRPQDLADRFVGWVKALRNPPFPNRWVPQSLHPLQIQSSRAATSSPPKWKR